MDIESIRKNHAEDIRQAMEKSNKQLESWENLSLTEKDHQLRMGFKETLTIISKARTNTLKLMEEWINDASIFGKIKNCVDFLAELKLTKETVESALREVDDPLKFLISGTEE